MVTAIIYGDWVKRKMARYQADVYCDFVVILFFILMLMNIDLKFHQRNEKSISSQ